MKLSEVIKLSQIIMHRGRYAYLKGKESRLSNHFFIAQDKDEITIVTEEKNVSNTKYDKDVKWFKLIEIQVSKPFLTVGFLAKVTKTIADKGLNILVISTFSKDYILVREKEIETAIKALEEIGFSVKRE